MKNVIRVIIPFLSVLCLTPTLDAASAGKTRLFVVSSYSREYLWSQETQKGLCAALKDFKFVENDAQLEDFTKSDFLETDTLVIQKAWMDSKRKNEQSEKRASAIEISDKIRAFKPDLILLGDDNAAHYIGSQFIDTQTPVVFWGVNGNPLKYGLVNTLEHPGHNVTGVYQPGFYKEGLECLKKLSPGLKTLAILSEDTETGRSHAKAVEAILEAEGAPFILTGEIRTNSYPEWQKAVLRLAEKADAFFVANHNSLKDAAGVYVDPLESAAWYLAHSKKPELVTEKQFVQEGLLLAADDSGFKQGYEAGRLADMILRGKKDPSGIPLIAPTRGKIIVNRRRAQELGIDLSDKAFVEESIDSSLALEKSPPS